MRAVPLAADATPAVIAAPRPRLSAIPWTLFWVSAGAINLLLGARVALGPGGSKDLLLVRQWASAALIDGVNPYRTTIPADYAPWSLLAVSPLLGVPASWLPALWVLLNAALGFVVARLGFTALAVNERPPLARAVGLLFAWAAFRIGVGNGQFVLLAVASGLASVCLARRGSAWSGPLLALALTKPQLGLAFVVWAAVERRAATLLVGVATVAAAVVAFSVRVHGLPTGVFADYLGVVHWELGSRFVRGSTDIRPLLDDFLGNREAAWLVTVACAGAALAGIAVVVSRMSDTAAARASLPLACLWTLTSTFHNTYDLVLLWPVWVGLWQLGQTGRRQATFVLGVLQAMLMLGIPGLWWKFSDQATHAQAAVGAAAVHSDRVLVLALLVYFLIVHWRHGRIAGEPSSRQS